MIPTMRHSGEKKSETMNMVKYLPGASGGREGRTGRTQRSFKAVKLFCMIL